MWKKDKTRLENQSKHFCDWLIAIVLYTNRGRFPQNFTKRFCKWSKLQLAWTSYLKGYPRQRQIGIRPELSGWIAMYFNGNSSAQFGSYSNSFAVWMGLNTLFKVTITTFVWRIWPQGLRFVQLKLSNDNINNVTHTRALCPLKSSAA